MARLKHLESFSSIQDVMREAERYGFPVRLATLEINSSDPIGHCIVKTKDELIKKAYEAMEWSIVFRVMVIPSSDTRFWHPKLIRENIPNNKLVAL